MGQFTLIYEISVSHNTRCSRVVPPGKDAIEKSFLPTCPHPTLIDGALNRFLGDGRHRSSFRGDSLQSQSPSSSVFFSDVSFPPPGPMKLSRSL